ncbi:MAG: hypothetical protein U9P79_00165 [Candidatus Cloacimonadota bacterium]|nr:hypothetical protein [Candidatus Cloacimonadota bacterium]
MKNIIFFGLFIITLVALTGCDWYAAERIIYEDWLCTVNTDGTDLTYIRESVGRHFVVTPDSERVILFGTSHIYSMNIDGSNFNTLNDSVGNSWGSSSPSIDETPEGTKIVFLYNTDIYQLDLESNEITNITNTQDIFEFYPCYSNNGTQIVYTTKKDSIITVSTMDYNGANNDIVVEYKNPTLDCSYFMFPSFSIDGEKIFYIWYGDSTCKIDRGLYSNNIGDSTNHFLFEGSLPFGISMPADGSKIVFYNNDNHIYIMNEDGSNLSDLGDADYYRPVISSDGSEIFFAKLSHIYIINSNGSGRRQLIDNSLNDYCKTITFLPDNRVMCSVQRRMR